MAASSSPSVAVVLAVAFWAASVSFAAIPPYKCHEFLRSSTTNCSIDKSGTGQLKKRDVACNDGALPGAIEPTGDINREVNQTYEAYCLFNSTLTNASDVVFVHWGKTPEAQYTYDTHEVVNSSAIRISITSEIAEQYDLVCQAKDDHLCQRTVNIGYQPQNVEDFNCISKNWRDLNCTWTAPYNPLPVAYNVTYVIPGFKDESNCSQRHLHRSWCYWPYEEFSLSVLDIWIVSLNATNTLNKNGVSFKYDINVLEIVLPDPVNKLEAHVDGPNNVTLTWVLPHPMDTFTSVLFEAAYKERHDGDVSEAVPWVEVDRWKVEPNRWVPGETFNKTISGLHAYIQYDFRVRIHTGFGPVRPHMWSEAATLTKRTSPLYPTVAPKTTQGAFQVDEMQSHRDIYVYWQKVDPLYHNGLGFHYVVKAYDTLYDRPILTKPADLEVRDTYAKFSNMEKEVPYRFEVIPENDEGLPQNESLKAVVIVPEKEEILKVPSYFKVIAYSEANRTIYSLKWRVEGALEQVVETVTLYWCKKNKYEERCQNKLEWEIVPSLNLNVKNLTHLEEKPLYMFGISLNSRTSSSGIKWITCIASNGNTPPPLEQFEITQVFSREVLLEWSLDCKAKAAEPTGFNISYCAVPQGAKECPVGGEVSFAVVDEAAEQYTVQNLHPYTEYIFSIAILTEIGPSQWSKNVHVKTESDKPSGPPQQLSVIEAGQTWVSLSWMPPNSSDRNGEIIKYEVKRLYEAKEEVKVSNTSEFTQFQYNVTGLDPYTNYTFEVIPCTSVRRSDVSCGILAASINTRTKIGVPSEVEGISQVDDIVKWDHDCVSGPNCSYELIYTLNSTQHHFKTKPYSADVNIRDLNISCTEAESQIVLKLRAFTHDENGQELYGPEKAQTITCYLPGLAWWIIVLIVSIAGLIVIIVLVVGRYGWGKIKEFLREWKRKPNLPLGLGDMAPPPRQKNAYYDIWPQISRDSVSNNEKQKTPVSPLSDGHEENECQDLIPPGGERGGRNLSGDSGTSENDPADSSGCSTGGESDSSSASDRVPQSSDSGTVQEEPGFHMDGNKFGGSGSLRLRTPGPPYVRQGLPDGMGGVGYVSASSVPNLAVGMTDGNLSLQPFTPNGALGTLPEMPLVARTSTGYISMPDADADAISLDVLNNLTLPHEGRQGGFPAYSRHNIPYKKTTPEISPYTKTASLPWLNSGYVAVSQAEGGRLEGTPPSRGYVAVSDAMGGVMKRQPSLPSLSTGFSKSVSTPDEDLPPGAYCRVGSRSSPGPPPGYSAGYVGITQALPLPPTPNSLTTTSPSSKSPYVTCAIAEALVSSSSTPEKVSGGYVSVGDMSGGRWAHPVIQREVAEDGREVASAPVEGTRGRPTIPTRPSTSEATVNHHRGGSRWPPLAPSLSKQSSGYVSQETLMFHDPVVMSPKRLLAQSHEPHSVVLSANHSASMV